MDRLFYQPEKGAACDFIPYYENGIFYLFYLRDYRDPARCGEGTPWHLITTRDFMHFEEHGEVLPRGMMDDQDLYVFTGSVLKYRNRYHIWYTGHNPYFLQKNMPQEAIMHAVSDDLFNWTKVPPDSFYAPKGFAPDDWRDPFVFRDGNDFRMLLAARSSDHAKRYSGLTAQLISEDGIRWQVTDPFWAPEMYFTHECPDLFRIGDWYYLLYSEFSKERVTHYRMSRSLEGPWLKPEDDRFDGCAYYAAKSAASGDKRYLFGWLSTREGEADDGAWEWGGCLVVHELFQRSDGTLGVRMPDSIYRAIRERTLTATKSIDGTCRRESAVCGVMDDFCAIDLQISYQGGNGSISLALFADENLEEGHFIRLELDQKRMVIDRWPREAHINHEPGLVRSVERWNQNGIRLTVIIDGTAACAYLDGELALCFRAYRQQDPLWGLIAEDVKIAVSPP